MRYLFFVLLLLLVATPAFADENIFNSSAAIKEEVKDVGNEAYDFVTMPADTQHNGLLYTVLAAGATGLTYAFDSNIRNMVQGNKSNGLDTATDVGNIVGSPFLHIGVAGALYGGGILAESPKYKEEGQMLGEALFLSDASTLILQYAVGRGRPFAAKRKGAFRPFQFKSDFNYMPSMHAASSFATAAILSSQTESTPVKILYYATATFVGFSRIYSDKHWASDVVLGAAIGELSGYVVWRYHLRKSRVAVLPAFTGK